MSQQLIVKLFEGCKGRAVPSVGICKILPSNPFRGVRERTQPGDHVSSRAVKICHSRSRQRRNAQTSLMVWQFDNHVAPCQFLRRQGDEGASQAALKNGLYNGVLYENLDRNKASSWKKARSPLPTTRVRVDICGPHQDIRRHVSSEEDKSSIDMYNNDVGKRFMK
jgi:hypothetical protein